MHIKKIAVLALSINILHGVNSSALAEYLKATKCIAWAVPDNIGNVTSSVAITIKNISSEALSVFATKEQVENFGMGHEMAMNCSNSWANGVPIVRRRGNEDFEEEARGVAVYLTPGSAMNIVFNKQYCRKVQKIKGYLKLKNGRFAGNVYIIMGNRFVVHSISCDF